MHPGQYLPKSPLTLRSTSQTRRRNPANPKSLHPPPPPLLSMAAAPIWELDDDGILEDLFADGVGEAAPPPPPPPLPPPPPPLPPLADFIPGDGLFIDEGMEAEEFAEYEEGAQLAGDEHVEQYSDQEGPQPPPQPPMEDFIPGDRFLIDHEMEDAEFAQDEEDEEMVEYSDLEEDGYLDLFSHHDFDGIIEHPDPFMQQLINEPHPERSFALSSWDDLFRVAKYPRIFLNTPEYMLLNYRFGDVVKTRKLIALLWVGRDWVSVGNFNLLVEAEELMIALERLSAVLDRYDAAPERVLSLADFILLLSSKATNQPPSLVMHVNTINAALASVVATALPEPLTNEHGRAPSRSIDTAAFKARVNVVLSEISKSFDADVPYQRDRSPQTELSSPLFHLPSPDDDGPYHRSFLQAEEEEQDQSLSSHNSASDEENVLPWERFPEVSLSNTVVRGLQDLQYIKANPDIYDGCQHFSIRSYNFFELPDIMHLIKQMRDDYPTRWTAVGNIELLQRARGIRELMADTSQELRGQRRLSVLQSLVRDLMNRSRLLRPRQLRLHVHKIITAMSALCAALTYQVSREHNSSAAANPSVLHEGDIVRLVQGVELSIHDLDFACILCPAAPSPDGSPDHV